MIYELVNPSDAWSFEAPSDKIAFLVALGVGRGATPAKRDGWDSGMYLFGKGDPAADFKKQFGEEFEGAVDRNRKEIVRSLRSFVIHREKAPKKMSAKERAAWNEKQRSSMNDFGGYANALADAIEKKAG